MEVMVLLIVFSMGLAGLFLLVFLRLVNSGAYEDMVSPSVSLLTEDQPAVDLSDKSEELDNN